MSYLSGNSKGTWQPTLSSDTTLAVYWLNWRFLLCAILVFIALVYAIYTICKERKGLGGDNDRMKVEDSARTVLYADEAWQPCLKYMNPGWLLAFRVFGFFVLLTVLILNGIVDGPVIFYYYTQWTFALVTIYFGMNAGAVVLTDCVFWLLIVPFLTLNNKKLNFFIINMHSINAVFLLGDTALNSLRFPWFRISYFFQWTCVYVVSQWLLHACIWIWWPYPVLDLSTPLSPLWYAAIGLMHIPCFGFFALLVKWKHMLLSKWFPDTYIPKYSDCVNTKAYK